MRPLASDAQDGGPGGALCALAPIAEAHSVAARHKEQADACKRGWRGLKGVVAWGARAACLSVGVQKIFFARSAMRRGRWAVCSRYVPKISSTLISLRRANRACPRTPPPAQQTPNDGYPGCCEWMGHAAQRPETSDTDLVQQPRSQEPDATKTERARLFYTTFSFTSHRRENS